jgi:hypothetical protein
VNRLTRQTLPTVNKKHFFMNALCVEPFCTHQKIAEQNAALRLYTPQTQLPLWLLILSSEHAHARLLPRLLWSWTVLLPSNIHRKTITSITADLLPFVPYVMTSLCISIFFYFDILFHILLIEITCLKKGKNNRSVTVVMQGSDYHGPPPTHSLIHS